MKNRSGVSSTEARAFYMKELDKLRKGRNSQQAQAICPFHNDKKPSLSINLQDGRFHCFGCGEKGSIFKFCMKRHDVGFKEAKEMILGRDASSSERGNISDRYDYTDKKGKLLYQAVRYEPKSFSFRRRENGKWIYNLEGVELVPYNLKDLPQADTALIVEGEKDVETLKALGFTPKKTTYAATTNPMGAGKWKTDYDEYFRDKDVVVFPDNDQAGKRHAHEVVASLNGTAKSIKIAKLPLLDEKEDLSDWAEKKGLGNKGKRTTRKIRKQLLQLIRKTPEWKPDIYTLPKGKDLFHRLPRGSDLMKLDIKIEWAIEKLIPQESITILHGRGGIGKTWLSLALADAVSRGQDFMGLKTKKLRGVYVDFENPFPVVADRVKKLGIPKLRFWHVRHTPKPPKLDDNDWVIHKELPKKSLLIFDTLRGSRSFEENNSKDMAFILNRLKELRDRGNTIILLHHTPKSNDKTYKGSTAILDLADHVLSLHKVTISQSGETELKDEEDSGGYGGTYELGTREKTRYESFHMYLTMEKDRGFVLASDPNDKLLLQLHSLMRKQKKTKGKCLNQKEIIKKAKSASIGKEKVRKLLKKGEGSYWVASRKGNFSITSGRHKSLPDSR